MPQGRLRGAMRRHRCSGRAVRHRDGLPREVVGSPAPGVLKERLGVGLADKVWWVIVSLTTSLW